MYYFYYIHLVAICIVIFEKINHTNIGICRIAKIAHLAASTSAGGIKNQTLSSAKVFTPASRPSHNTATFHRRVHADRVCARAAAVYFSILYFIYYFHLLIQSFHKKKPARLLVSILHYVPLLHPLRMVLIIE